MSIRRIFSEIFIGKKLKKEWFYFLFQIKKCSRPLMRSKFEAYVLLNTHLDLQCHNSKKVIFKKQKKCRYTV